MTDIKETFDVQWFDPKTHPIPEDGTPVLVYLEKAMAGPTYMGLAVFHKNFKTINGLFHFDAPKVLKWTYAPNLPLEHENNHD